MISIIIINYRQKDLTIQCVRSVYENFKSHPFEVIVINNSPDEDLSELELKHRNLKLILNENKGFSQANNIGAQAASGDYLFFLNADTLIRSDFFGEFVKSFSERKFGAAGMKLYNPDETFQLSFWKENTFFNEIENKDEEKKFKERNLNYIKEKEKEYDEIKEVDWVSGAAMIIKPDVFKKAGGFDEKYFFFYEDADICKTLNDAGYKNYFFPFSNIIHFKGENVNKDFHNTSYYYSKDSQLKYYDKHNNFFNNFILRAYLIVKFAVLYVFTFNNINLRILKRVLGVKER